MSKIEIKDLTFGYDQQGTLLFDHADLNLESTWKLGLIGRNGRGKTTLLKLLQHQLPFSGQINQPLNFVYFPQTIADPTHLTYQLIESLSPSELWEVQRELNLLQVDEGVLWRPFADLSGGEQTKVLLALLFTDTTNYPLIDEPTNHLDLQSRQQVARYLRQKQQGFIVVSHDRHFIDETTDHILAIDKAKLTLMQGNFSSYEQQKRQQDDYEQAQNSKLKKDIGRLRQTAAEKAAWSHSREKDKYGQQHVKNSGAIGDTGFIGARAARTMKRSKNLQHRMETEISEKETLLKNIEYIDPLGINFQPTFRKNLLTVKNFQLSYEKDQPLFQPVSFQLERGQQLALVGPNGVGKSSLIRTLLGEFRGIRSGEFQMSNQLKISRVRQDYQDNRGSLADFAESQRLDYQLFLNNLHKLGLPRNAFSSRIEQLSMGQQKKVELAKSLAQPAELYLWDEPLNYLDVFNQEQLEQLIADFQPTLLLIEHDQDFIAHVTDQVIQLRPQS
ncbi:ribosomal protection-like ABC-F family protein [Lapidilactobacillus salsurivasis]